MSKRIGIGASNLVVRLSVVPKLRHSCRVKQLRCAVNYVRESVAALRLSREEDSLTFLESGRAVWTSGA